MTPKKKCSCGTTLHDDINTYGNPGEESCFDCYTQKEEELPPPKLILVDYSDAPERLYDQLKTKYQLALIASHNSEKDFNEAKSRYEARIAETNDLRTSLEVAASKVRMKISLGIPPTLFYWQEESHPAVINA